MKTVEIEKIPKLYGRPKTISALFDIGQTKTLELIGAMRKSVAYREYVVTKPKMTLVRIDAFDRFLRRDDT